MSDEISNAMHELLIDMGIYSVMPYVTQDDGIQPHSESTAQDDFQTAIRNVNMVFGQRHVRTEVVDIVVNLAHINDALHPSSSLYTTQRPYKVVPLRLELPSGAAVFGFDFSSVTNHNDATRWFPPEREHFLACDDDTPREVGSSGWHLLAATPDW